jgi:hypothetical protein
MNFNKLIGVLFVLVLGTPVAVAQGPAPPPALNEVPLDGLSTALIAAGVAYGGRKLTRKRE